MVILKESCMMKARRLKLKTIEYFEWKCSKQGKRISSGPLKSLKCLVNCQVKLVPKLPPVWSGQVIIRETRSKNDNHTPKINKPKEKQTNGSLFT